MKRPQATAVFRLAAVSLLALASAWPAHAQSPSYQIHAIRYGTIADFALSGLVMGAPRGETIDIDLVLWVLRGDGRLVLFDTGFHRPAWFERFDIADYVRPDSAVRLLGVEPAEVTDIVVSHAHWDHMGGLDLFPNAMIWIQRGEFAHYTGPAWQEGRGGGGADPEDLLELVRRNTLGLVTLVDGNAEILPGITAYAGARHTYASQYIAVDGDPTVVLASDNAYLYRNLRERRPVATFTAADTVANLEAQARMIALAGDTTWVVPGHDPLQFERFPSEGRVARIR